MKRLIQLLLLLMLISCLKTEVPIDSELIAKYIVFDENISPKLNVCPDTILRFNSKSISCLFQLEEFIFQPEFRIGLSKEGYMVQLDEHSVTKKIDYQSFGILKDTTNWSEANGKDYWIRFSKNLNKIIDGNDTIKIVRVFPENKLIFVESKNEKKGRRFIYEYK